MKQRILVTGACGQIGTELVPALREHFGRQNVIATDLYERSHVPNYHSLNVLDDEALGSLVRQEEITQVYHLAAALSASAEQKPLSGWELNMRGLLNVLECAKVHQMDKVFWPSSIAVFGPESPKGNCPQNALTDPVTVYGISKVAGESWCKYYREKYGLDVRSIRYPGLVSHTAKAGGGTTDYAVEIFHAALDSGEYTCYLEAGSGLPMLYMPDAVRGTLELMAAPKLAIGVKTAYNLSGLHFSPRELAAAIAARVKGFTISYAPDYRQQIADSWPLSIDDQQARFDWNWSPRYSLDEMVDDMLQHLQLKKITV